MGTALARHQAQTDLVRKAESYGLCAEAADGMDVLAVEAAARRVAEAVRAGLGPHFLELRTYRFRAHSMYDPELYRTKEEVEEWKTRDPVSRFAATVRDWDLLSDADLAAVEVEVTREIEGAVRVAEEGPWEPVEDLTRDVHTPAGTPCSSR
jgi:TPP-dependent pyruvate/acetoin dehydrogenase alpha subunit